MKGGAVDSFVLALSPLMDDPVIDQEVMNVFGCMWSGISTNEDKGVVTGVARVEGHPLSFWVVSVLFYVLSLSGGMGHFGWGGDTVKEGRWRCVD